MRDFFSEMVFPLLEWRLVYIRAYQGIRIRFARSYLGQFWITISLAILISVTGVVWGLIWNVPVDEFLPYAACGHILYLFLATTINESSKTIIDDKGFYFHRKRTLYTSIYVLIVRNFFILLYNLPVLAAVIFWSDSARLAINALYPFYIVTVILYLFLLTFLIAMVCIFFRDLIQLIQTIMSVMFLLTPVLWKVDLVPEHLRLLVFLNPFASLLEVMRNPIIGQAVHFEAVVILWISIGIFLPVNWLIWSLLRKKAIFWM